ncbi:MAG: cation:dicarboxylase symporter family transporter, partial [Firmicutes bacterium]|nr:cation:dicarboxylase symporter family transporter [Bacillota bacterium]
DGILLIAGVDRIFDMIRTSMNVVGDAAGAVVVAATEGELKTLPTGVNVGGK